MNVLEGLNLAIKMIKDLEQISAFSDLPDDYPLDGLDRLQELRDRTEKLLKVTRKIEGGSHEHTESNEK